ncbi:MAG TPA: site-specific integrase [Isoptericola sp.]|nr:site-specific integrase [Isoptericola sp.]
MDGRNRTKLVQDGVRYYLPDDDAHTTPQRPRWKAHTRFRDSDGVTRLVEAWGASGAAAERALTSTLTERAARTDSTVTAATRLHALAEFWLRTDVRPSTTRGTRTKDKYDSITRTVIVPAIGQLMLRECTAGRLDRFLRTTAAEHPANARTARSCLTQMFSVAVREGALGANPAKETSSIRTEPATEGVDVLTLDEVRTIRKLVYADPWAVDRDLHHLVDVMLGTSARIGEVLALRWSDVNLDAGTVAITGTIIPKTSNMPQHRQPFPKSRKHRVQRLPRPTRDVLALRLATVPAGEHDLVFPPQGKTPYRDPSNTGAQLRTWRERQEGHPELDRVTSHFFRRTGATEVERAAGLDVAAKQLGHSNSQVTARHYVQRVDLGPDVTAILETLYDEAAGTPGARESVG